jgi:CheY-like chemotaxis protein
MLMNLAINARDAMPGGGRLTIRTGVEDVSEEDARQMPDASAGRFVCVAVSDTGRGIAPEHLPRIFEPFFTTKEAGKGTGLGLATVYGIVRQHHGWLRVASTAGCGTTFEVFLRALDAAAEATGHRRDLEQSPGGTETILLVEDDYSVRQIGRTVLERLGYRVIEALSGAAALQAWAEAGGAVDLLLTDLVMPGGMGGRELAAQLRVKKPALEVIYCSGYSAEFMGRDFVLEEGVNFLQKPYEFHHLARIVRARLDGRAKETG